MLRVDRSRWARRSPPRSAVRQKKRSRGVTFNPSAVSIEVDLMSPAKRRMTMHRDPAELDREELSIELDRCFQAVADSVDAEKPPIDDGDEPADQHRLDLLRD